ncbi:MAG: hypothetical protein RLZZ210_296 [Pseudomonadota bacterium]|jgi:DNA-nicking Smr family endonuclease
MKKKKYKIIDDAEWQQEIKTVVPISHEMQSKYCNLELDNGYLDKNHKYISVKSQMYLNHIHQSDDIINNTYVNGKDIYDLSNNFSKHEPNGYSFNQDENTYIKNGINKKALKKLKRIKVSDCPVLDLHGYTIASAYGALQSFIYNSYHQYQKYIIIVHGKGLSSPNSQPVLKPKILNWLMDNLLVMAFTESAIEQGGSGATVVLLKVNYNHEFS